MKTKLKALERLDKDESHRYIQLLNSTLYVKVAIDNMSTNEHGCVPIKLFTETGRRLGQGLAPML